MVVCNLKPIGGKASAGGGNNRTVVVEERIVLNGNVGTLSGQVDVCGCRIDELAVCDLYPRRVPGNINSPVIGHGSHAGVASVETKSIKPYAGPPGKDELTVLGIGRLGKYGTVTNHRDTAKGNRDGGIDDVGVGGSRKENDRPLNGSIEGSLHGSRVIGDSIANSPIGLNVDQISA